MEYVEVLIPVILFISTAIVLALYIYYRYRARSDRQETIRLALEKGTELSPDFLARLGEAEPSKDKDLRRGLIWMALAATLSLCGLALARHDIEVLYGCLAGAAFPFAIGAAYLLMWWYGSKQTANA